ncbi:unnamed protein product, partial [Nesidiocoris tenuis]
ATAPTSHIIYSLSCLSFKFSQQDFNRTAVATELKMKSKNITVTGAPGHLIDCDGKRWWDGRGGNGGVKKPKFFFARLTDSSIVNLNVKNTPVHAFSINTCKNLLVSGITIDNTDGDCAHGGHNTDGFDVGCSSNITIKDCIVKNQDDCLAVNSGKDIVFEGNFCSGGHGISIGSVGGRKDNVVERVLLKNNIVADSANGTEPIDRNIRAMLRIRTLLLLVGGALASEFTVNKFEDVQEACRHKNIVISDIEVPAGQTLEFSGLKQGTKITFVGKVTFGFTTWEGPLIRIIGEWSLAVIIP